jgi:hypothetical protein
MSARRIRCARPSSTACEQAAIRAPTISTAEPGGRRLFPAHDAQGAALVDRARLSQAGAQAAAISRSCRTR